jgi:cold shock CspA family protein
MTAATPAPNELPLQTGIVKWFSDSLKYGFITLPEGVDIFVHRDNLSGQKICEGDTVEFRIERRGADGRPWAKQVRRVDGTTHFCKAEQIDG